METASVRVRIAPSPTGDPHVGLAYITLFNYVLKKKHQGKLILRIEDTDQTRYRKHSEEQIIEALNWLGLCWDEGPDKNGPLGPYRQSERLPIYKEHVQKLVDAGKAYPCFCSSARLQNLRETQRQNGQNPGYDQHCLSLEPKAIQQKMADNIPYVIRLKTPSSGMLKFKDELRGEIEIDARQIDDQVLLKSDGFPTYHLANVVDDHLMQISHVIRAEEWISSTPKHILLYQAFAWQPPLFIHLPILRNQDRSKISKRKNPVSLTYYKRKGILADAMVNFLALMGWSYDSQNEIFSLEQMIEAFQLKDIHLGGPIFDGQKLLSINQIYLKNLSEQQFVKIMQEEIFSKETLQKLYPLVHERLGAFEEFTDKFSFFFNGSLNYDGLKIFPDKWSAKEIKDFIHKLLDDFENIQDFDTSSIDTLLKEEQKKSGLKPKEYFLPIRMLLTGRKDSPPLAETIAALGKDIVRFRLFDALKFFKKT